MGNPVSGNPLRTRADVARAAVQMIEPLLPLMSPGKARLHLGDTGAVYPDGIAEMEAFSRPLWAIVPMLAGNCEGVDRLWSAWREGIIHGVDPEHPEYWGEVGDYDQRLVEMAVFGMGMAIAPERFFLSLPERAQDQLWAWLDQINHHDMPKNNWVFFRVLVNMGFLVCGRPYDQARLEADFALMEEHYEGDGWYFDYVDQRDYYTLWGFHYYGLVYAKVMRDRDPQRCEAFLRRSRMIAKEFACWFDGSGEALPFGRSLTYRFAQGSFYSALALAEAESAEIDYGAMKRLLLGNLRGWVRRPIFTRDGVLTIGYGYPNLLMAEGYNAPGSPYWGMKAFACLALPEDHPFWTAREHAPVTPPVSRQEHARMLITRSADGSHVTAFTAGHHAPEHAHDEAKYEKFAYSTVFGFSVCKAQKMLKAGAFDSMLALSEDGETYHPRYGCESYAIEENAVRAVWRPFPGVTVETTVCPHGEWHVREHIIRTDRPLYAAEGGYAIARDGQGSPEITEQADRATVAAPWGVSAVFALQGYDAGCVLQPEPNTNLMVPRTLLPTLTAKLSPGEHRLVCAVLGTKTGTLPDDLPKEVIRYETVV